MREEPLCLVVLTERRGQRAERREPVHLVLLVVDCDVELECFLLGCARCGELELVLEDVGEDPERTRHGVGSVVLAVELHGHLGHAAPTLQVAEVDEDHGQVPRGCALGAPVALLLRGAEGALEQVAGACQVARAPEAHGEVEVRGGDRVPVARRGMHGQRLLEVGPC